MTEKLSDHDSGAILGLAPPNNSALVSPSQSYNVWSDCVLCVCVCVRRLCEPGLPAGAEGGVCVPPARAHPGPSGGPRQGHAGQRVSGEILQMPAW